MVNSLKFAYDFDVYLAEDVGDFLVNRDRVYVSPIKQFNFLFPYTDSFYVKMHDVCLERVKVNDRVAEGHWVTHDDTGQFISLWHGGEKGVTMRSDYTFDRANNEQGFEPGDWLYSLTLRHFQKVGLPVIMDLEKERRPRLPKKDSLKDKIREKFDKIILGDPVPEPS